MLSLPQAFEEYSESRKAGFLKVKNAKESGRKVAGYFCTFTPLEILDAAGIIPVSLCGMSAETIPAAERDLPKNLCPLIKSSYGFYISDKCPYTYFADLIVGETTCDGKKKMYELMGRGKEVYVLHLPQGADLPYAKEMWRTELRRFRDYLQEKFGVTITDDALRAAAIKRNLLRKRRTELMELLQAECPPISGTELYTFLDGLGFRFSVDESISAVEELIATVKGQQSPQVHPHGKRILVTGCPIGGVLSKTVGAVERNGGNVVCYENCSGAKQSDSMVDTDRLDILDAIADAYLQVGCAVMTPDSRRMTHLEELLPQYHIDGVIDISLQTCQPYLLETNTVRQLCRDSGVPYLALETDYSPNDAGQLDTRIAAFLETLER